jgi:hypothetical protein
VTLVHRFQRDRFDLRSITRRTKRFITAIHTSRIAVTVAAEKLTRIKLARIGSNQASNLTLFIVLYQIRERFEVDSFIHDFECHPQRRNDPEQGVDRHVFTGFQVNNRFAIALGFVRQLLLAIAFSTAQQAYSLAEGWGIQNQHNVTYIGLLHVEV